MVLVGEEDPDVTRQPLEEKDREENVLVLLWRAELPHVR